MKIIRKIPDRSFKQKLWRYWINWWIGLDQWVNTWIGGDPDEVMSSRFGKWLSLPHNTWRWKVAYAVCRVLHLFDKNHCIDSIELDEGQNAVWRSKKEK